MFVSIGSQAEPLISVQPPYTHPLSQERHIAFLDAGATRQTPPAISASTSCVAQFEDEATPVRPGWVDDEGSPPGPRHVEQMHPVDWVRHGTSNSVTLKAYCCSHEVDRHR
jgi:hypothetical protein